MEYFSKANPKIVYAVPLREQKGRKILSVLSDYYNGDLGTLSLLDIGCSSGVISNILSHSFGTVTGIDIDTPAIRYAKNNYNSNKLQFSIQDASTLGFPDRSFDVVVCSHIYEHVSDPVKLMSEIYRVLKAEGVCYFAAENRLRLIESHYKLPLLSIVPVPLAHRYLQILNRGSFYHERPLSLSGLRRLVSKFEVIDYTFKIMEDPQRYHADDLLQKNSVKQRMALQIARMVYWLCPTYVWLLRKNGVLG